MRTSAIYLLACLLLQHTVSAQYRDGRSRKEIRKEQWLTDVSFGGIGIELGNPSFGKDVYLERKWMGVHIAHSLFIGGYAQGQVSMDYVVNPFISGDKSRSPVLNGRKYYLGMNIPLKILTFGRYRTYNRVFRGIPFIQTTLGYANFSYQAMQKTSVWDFAVMPGYRIRIPYGSVDIGFEAKLNFMKGGPYEESFDIFTYNPRIVLRLDGLLERFNPSVIQVQGVRYSSSYIGSDRSSTTEYHYDGSRTVYERTTDYYSVSTSPTTVSLTDIGPYLGLGVRVGTNGFLTNYYTNMGTSVGLNLLYRRSQFIFGFNLDYAQSGHATTARDGALPETRNGKKIDKTITGATGTINAINIMADAGLDFNRLLMALAGTVVEENEATPFMSVNAGYSAGFSMLLKQEFDDPSGADQYLQSQSEQSKYNNAALSKPGYVGAWFAGTDIGTTSFRVSWYQYKNAPLANHIQLSVAWRFITLGR